MSVAEPQIADELKAGNEAAYEILFREYYSRLSYFAHKYVEDMDVAEGLVQDVFFTIWEKRETLEIKQSVKAYLFGAVRNKCLNHIKHLQVRQEYQTAVKHQNNNSELTEEIADTELEERIHRAIDQLPVERQKVFKLSRFEGLKYVEIADQLSISVKTVENQMGKALKFMREQLADYLPVMVVVIPEVIKKIIGGQ